MTLPIKTRLAKRKLEIKEVRKEKQTVTSKKHDKNCFNEKNVEVLDDTDTDLLKEAWGRRDEGDEIWWENFEANKIRI